MGVVGMAESRRAEMEELCRNLVASAGIHWRKHDEGIPRSLPAYQDEDEDEEGTLVCVTSGVSYLGLALVNQLLIRGYSVRITVENPEDIERLREMEGPLKREKMEAVMAKLTEIKDLERAFEGCRGLFHITAFTDPAGLSGYTKSMAEIEVKVTENVMEACARTPSIKRCVFTSSLAACVWPDSAPADLSSVAINHASWSSESLCTDRKLWYALGKMRAEKTAWRIANEKGLKLTSICPALITGPEFCRKNPTATIAYLKGAQEMYSRGVLATTDVTKLAEAHVSVFRAMNKNAFGRYICYENMVDSQSEAENLAKEIGMPVDKICGAESNYDSLRRFELSNEKLCRLMSRPLRCYSEH